MPPQYADRSPVATRIRTLRQQSNLSQQALGAQLGVSAVSVSKWERGQSQPDIATLTRLADIFGTTIDDLCGREGTSAPAPAPDPEPENITVMARAFRQLTPEEQEKYLAVGRALFAHAFDRPSPPTGGAGYAASLQAKTPLVGTKPDLNDD